MAGSSLTKMHFISAAQIVRGLRVFAKTPAKRREADAVQNAFLKLFQEYNHRFDADRFDEACKK